MEIYIHNYEAYFEDYLNKNLSTEQVAELMVFLSEHPELEAELYECSDVFIKKEKKTSSFDSSFLKKSIFDEKDQNEIFIAKLENDLSEEDLAEVNTILLKDEEKVEEFNWFLKTKLIADQSITYPNKDELISIPEKKKIVWLYPAVSIAASLILALLVYAFWPSTNELNVADQDKKNEAQQMEKISDANQIADHFTALVVKKEDVVADNTISDDNKTIAKEDVIPVDNRSEAIENNAAIIYNSEVYDYAYNKMDDLELILSKESKLKVIEADDVLKPLDNTIEDLALVISAPSDYEEDESYLSMKEVLASFVTNNVLEMDGNKENLGFWDYASASVNKIGAISKSDLAMEIKPVENQSYNLLVFKTKRIDLQTKIKK
jgi:hypothetical protein